MGMYDNVRIDRRWLPECPEWLIEAYGSPETVKFQTKSLDCALANYRIQVNGILEVMGTEWVDDPGAYFGGFIRDTGIWIRQNFSGVINAYSGLWNSGKPDTGSWPSKVYANLGDYEVLLYVEDGCVFRSKLVKSEPPILK